MAARGHGVLVMLGGEGPVTVELAVAGVPFLTLRHLRRPIDPLRDALAYRELVRVLRAFSPDLVSTHTAKAGWLGRAAAAKLRIPALYTPHGLPVAGRFRGMASAVFAVAERAASRWHSGVICVSESERRLALASRIADERHVFVVHNGVRDVPPEFRAAPECEPVRICCVARFAEPKDHATLLVALAALRSREWSLDLVGDGPTEARMRRLARQLGLDRRVRFRGYQPDPEAVLASSQIFALATRSEALPRSVLEAMRAGLPVVASDVGGVSEAVEQGSTGLLVPPEDPQALAAALDSLLTDAHLRARMGLAARHAFERQFRLEQTVENTLAVYRAIMDA
jgi:glycosyltransferase involved in cell wall biosynthesis